MLMIMASWAGTYLLMSGISLLPLVYVSKPVLNIASSIASSSINQLSSLSNMTAGSALTAPFYLVSNRFTRTSYDLSKLRELFHRPDMRLDDTLSIMVIRTHEYKFKIQIKYDKNVILNERFSPTLTSKNTTLEYLARQFIEGAQQDEALNLFSSQWENKNMFFKITVEKFIGIANTSVRVYPSNLFNARPILQPSSRKIIGDIKLINKKRTRAEEEPEQQSSRRRRIQ